MARIGIEAGDTLRKHRAGMARYTSELITALAELAPAHDIETLLPYRRLLRGGYRPREFPSQWFQRGRGVRGYDLVHATCCIFPGPRESTGSVEVATLHDLFNLTGPGADPTDAQIREQTTYLTRADRVICVSESARRDLHRVTDYPESQSVSIPLGVSPEFQPATADAVEAVRRRYQLPEQFFLFVGRLRPTKNFDRLIEAYAISGSPLPLRLAGPIDAKDRNKIATLAENHQIANRVEHIGFVDEADLPTLLSCATALLFPSIFEGFGLPVLEAMACGTAVLTSKGISTEEVAGGFATLIDPFSVDDIARGINAVTAIDDAQISEATAWAQGFTWRENARRTLEVYESLLP